jgi:iron complex outermembrane receptor protein
MMIATKLLTNRTAQAISIAVPVYKTSGGSSLQILSAQNTQVSRMHPMLLALGVVLNLGAFSASTHATSGVLEEVIVSGKADPRLSSLLTGTEVRSISEDEQITASLSPASLAEAIPGVSMNGQGGLFQSYSLRGFSRWRIRTEISGVPILTDRRAGNSLSFLAPGLIDTIRVNMGPASSLYGSGAMGGVMNVSLARPTETSLRVGVSSMGNAYDMLFKTPVSERTALVTSFRSANSSKSGNDTRLNTSYEQSMVYASDEGHLGQATVTTEAFISNGRDIGKSTALFPNSRVTDYPQDDHRLVNVRMTTPNQWFFQAYGHHQDWSSHIQRINERQNTSFYSSTTIGGLVSHSRRTSHYSERYGLDATRRYDVDIVEQSERPGESKTSSSVVAGGSEWSTGLFWERTWYMDGLALQAGLRADKAEANVASSSRARSDLNLQIKADFQLTPDLALRAELGSGYRLPTLSELYFEGETPRGRLIGNEELLSEETVGAQFTLVYEGSATAFEITASANQVDNYIERVAVSPGLESYRNLSSGDIRGIDGQVTWRGDKSNHTLSWQSYEGESALGEFIADLPPPTLRYAATRQLSGYSLGMDLRYRFSRRNVGPGEAPIASAVVLGVSATWNISRQWSARTSITNSLNRNYRTSASVNAPLEMGRAINININWHP